MATDHNLNATFHGNCVICGEEVWSDDDPAEMHHPDNPEEYGGICHGQCGLEKGWQIS